MNAQDFWERYVGEYTPAEFMARYQSRNPRRCAERYVSRLPSMYGIVRQRTWRKTFISSVQHVRESVVAGLTVYLEQTRPEWEQALAERAEREQAEWEQAERERLEREQRDWERAQLSVEPSAPAHAENAGAAVSVSEMPGGTEVPPPMATGGTEVPPPMAPGGTEMPPPPAASAMSESSNVMETSPPNSVP
ncbi:MAG TPA: hypothetical protein PLI09_05120 [Candidatus Hydrogenedentes bacterium]|nr:hypothetical protein [Candidatus Hydrogenedentota bacterium]